MPHELIALKPRDVVQLVLKYHERLAASLSQSKIDAIAEQHKQLLKAIDSEPTLQSSVNRHADKSDFSEAWSSPGLKNRFPELMEFLGGLASPFPNASTVESDFSVLKWEKDIHNLTSLSMEGIMHCRQIRSLLKESKH
jgi:hypothetical protein